MQRCLQLALLGKGHVKSNPMVGAVLVHKNAIIGEGYHQKYGEAHAEVNCINSVSESKQHLIPESTLYVSLEPCIHFGKTPPCADLIISNGIKTVVIACSDPFAQVNGGGIKKLQEAGVRVFTPFLETQAQEINKRFFTFHQKKRPYIILKWAQSQDNKIASIGRRYMISNSLTNALVHKWRSEEGAILIGTNTALIDNPSLTTRFWPGDNPLRLVIDTSLKLPADTGLLKDDEPLIIFNAVENKQSGNKLYYKCGTENILPEVLQFLFQRNITSLIVEGGTVLLQSFIDAGLWDEARIITNQALQIREGVEAPILKSGALQNRYEVLSDEVIIKINAKASQLNATIQ